MIYNNIFILVNLLLAKINQVLTKSTLMDYSQFMLRGWLCCEYFIPSIWFQKSIFLILIILLILSFHFIPFRLTPPLACSMESPTN